MNKVFYYVVLIAIIFMYVFSINYFALVINQETLEQKNSPEIKTGFNFKLSFNDQISIVVKKERWYGTIFEYVGKDSKSVYLELYDYVRNEGEEDQKHLKLRIPLYKTGFNFMWIHYAFLSFLFAMVFLIHFEDINKKEVENVETNN